MHARAPTYMKSNRKEQTHTKSKKKRTRGEQREENKNTPLAPSHT